MVTCEGRPECVPPINHRLRGAQANALSPDLTNGHQGGHDIRGCHRENHMQERAVDQWRLRHM